MRNCETLFPVFVQWVLLLQDKAPINLNLHHPTKPPLPSPPTLLPGQPLGHFNFLIVFKANGSVLDARREIYAGVFLDIWFDFICPHNSYSLLFLRYVLQPIRIRFTALSCSETNIYLCVSRLALRKIEGSPVLLTCKIQGTQHMICTKIWDFLVAQEQQLGTRGHRALLEYSPVYFYEVFYLSTLTKQSPIC